MAHFFDEVRAIVLNKGTKKEKIERLQKELKVTRYEAETFYTQLSPMLSIIRATTTRPAGAKLRFTMGVEIECFGIDRYAIKAASSGAASSPTLPATTIATAKTATSWATTAASAARILARL